MTDQFSNNPGIEGGGMYRFDNDRAVTLISLNISSTYAGVCEGTLETASKSILKRLREESESSAGSQMPLVVVKPQNIPLPDYKVVASFDSRRGVQTTDCMFRSQLSICSFIESTDETIDQIAQALLSHVDWNAHAADYDIMDF